jgi:hypothetical protein
MPLSPDEALVIAKAKRAALPPTAEPIFRHYLQGWVVKYIDDILSTEYVERKPVKMRVPRVGMPTPEYLDAALIEMVLARFRKLPQWKAIEITQDIDGLIVDLVPSECA